MDTNCLVSRSMTLKNWEGKVSKGSTFVTFHYWFVSQYRGCLERNSSAMIILPKKTQQKANGRLNLLNLYWNNILGWTDILSKHLEKLRSNNFERPSTLLYTVWLLMVFGNTIVAMEFISKVPKYNKVLMGDSISYNLYYTFRCTDV